MSNNTAENFSIQGYNLVTLLKRLETATSRLEDITIFQEKRGPAPAAIANNAPVELEAKNNGQAITALPAAATTEESAATEEPIAKSVLSFQEFIDEHVKPLVTLSKELDTVLSHQTDLLLSAFEKEKEVIQVSLDSKPLNVESSSFQEHIIKPINSIIMKIIELKDGNRTHAHFSALNALAEGVAVLGWVCVKTPVSYVPEFKDSAQFWTNRVLKEFKSSASDGDETAKKWVDWVKLYLAIFDELKVYVKEWAATGLVFKGDKDYEDALKDSSAKAVLTFQPSSGGAAPPPPPPPPPPANLFDNLEGPKATETSSAGMGAVFAELNKGEGITSGLKKVDKSEMTHKNPELRKKSGPAPPKKPQSLSSTKPTPANSTEKPPKKELVDNKWMILNQVDAGFIEIDVTMDQSVFIGNCANTVVKMTGKVNAVSVNNSTKVGIVVERAVSSVELNKCKSCEVQVMEWVPVMSVDQSESVSLYLTGEEASQVEIYSSGTTALNVNIPEGDDVKEMPIAEQFKTTVVDGKLVTIAVNGE